MEGFDREDREAVIRQIDGMIAKQQIQTTLTSLDDQAVNAYKTDILNQLSRVGMVVTELGDENIRERSLYSYHILYETTGHGVFVLSVTHKRRDLQPEMIER